MPVHPVRASRPIGFDMHLEGHKELIETIDNLRRTAQRQVMLPAIREGLKPIRKTARTLVPVRYGFLKKWILSKAWIGKKTDIVYGAVGARRGRTMLLSLDRQRAPSPYFPLLSKVARLGRRRARAIIRAVPRAVNAGARNLDPVPKHMYWWQG